MARLEVAYKGIPQNARHNEPSAERGGLPDSSSDKPCRRILPLQDTPGGHMTGEHDHRSGLSV